MAAASACWPLAGAIPWL
ncbi:hypothetical protein HaLaN_31785 [Haematococcus lacustris]|uniref:Uncharacterized protein n=1 Tax=Haematococcus lacustris TaxID=44745 RepID=A0A6A0AL25_HAELA|nr:hypothetical protein HaLaN_31785 [Haematococcus lacustris]